MLKKVEKDERTTFIENKSYKYGYMILSFGILIDIAYRSVIFNHTNQTPWDLFLLLGIAGVFMELYKHKQKIFAGNWKKTYLIPIVLTAILGALLAFIFTRLKVLG